MTTYWEKLQDPRWQKKRLEAMQAKEFVCEVCFDGESMLQVHHKEYFTGRNPWEYDLNQLAVLCKNCHENHHSSMDMYKTVGSFLSLAGPFSRETVAFMNCGYLGYSYENSLEMFGFEHTDYMKRIYFAGELARKHIFKDD